MHWTLADNLAEILAALQTAADAGASLCLLPELALSGFHRRMPESLDPASLAAARLQLSRACQRLRIAAVLGVPELGAAGQVFNSLLFIDAQGQELACTRKRGLTPSEASFFTPGGARVWVEIDGVLATAVLCRETLDGAAVLPELRAALTAPAGRPSLARVIFWPSYIAASDPEQAALTEAYRAGAQTLAAELQAWVIQCNWPGSLNQPEARGFGGSVVVSPQGELVSRLPLDAAGLAVIELPQGRCSWRPAAG